MINCFGSGATCLDLSSSVSVSFNFPSLCFLYCRPWNPSTCFWTKSINFFSREAQNWILNFLRFLLKKFANVWQCFCLLIYLIAVHSVIMWMYATVSMFKTSWHHVPSLSKLGHSMPVNLKWIGYCNFENLMQIFLYINCWQPEFMTVVQWKAQHDKRWALY